MKKTIAALAVSASSAFALIGPGSVSKTVCLEVREDAKGALFAGSCDQSRNNKALGKEILSNGCAAEQVALRATKFEGGNFNPQISNCLPPNVVQL